jgi:drug/metabolite transporter (DMT)-like permease
VGHSLINYAMKHFRGQLVSIINMGQFVFAGIMAYFLFAEVPAPSFYVASGMLILSAWIAVRGELRAQPRTQPSEACS